MINKLLHQTSRKLQKYRRYLFGITTTQYIRFQENDFIERIILMSYFN